MPDLTLQSDGQRVLYLRHIDRELWEAVKEKAAMNDITLRAAVLEALDLWSGAWRKEPK